MSVPKNIVLLSDGTGNSAAKPFLTNVRRLRLAIDTEPPAATSTDPQIVCYHDGVGTGSFRPLVLLGLAFGIGTARIVKDLYAFLCRNYQEGDKIFIFGFSRGAFAARLLADLIVGCGVVSPGPTEATLADRVEHAYSVSRRDAARRAIAGRWLLVAGHLLRLNSWLFHRNETTFASTDRRGFQIDQRRPDIAFVGLWDTVDAYGLPIDELKWAIDRFIWPMTFVSRPLDRKIGAACHALALDEDRPAFRPVLWSDDESFGLNKRLRQVWFAGAHADVGGGYPEDGLSYVSLQWMMDEAENAGLRFRPDLKLGYSGRIDVQAPHHDPRTGLAGYYRYGPRSVDALSSDRRHQVSVKRPVIHQSVIDRIRRRQVAYAPIGFPRIPSATVNPDKGYLVQERDPQMAFSHEALRIGHSIEAMGGFLERLAAMRSIETAVFRRQFAYLTTVALTAWMIILPALDRIPAMPSWFHHSALADAPLFSDVAWWVSWSIGLLGRLGAVPGWATPWASSFAAHPLAFITGTAGALLFFVRVSPRIQDQILERTEHAWRMLKD